MATTGVRQIVLRVASTLTDDWRVAMYPDHPHAYHGPQVLAGSAGTLLGVFVPTRSDERNPARLASRLSIARLSLPLNAKCVLVVSEQARHHDDLYAHFDLVLPMSDLKLLPRLARSEEQRIVRRQLAAVQLDTTKRYNAFLRMGKRHWDRVATGTEDSAESRRDVLAKLRETQEGAARPVPGGFLEYDLAQSIVLASRLQAEKGIPRRIAALTLSAVKQSYSLDNGIPYLVRRTPYVLLLDKWPSAKFDPNKPSRAAAFTGIALAAPRSSDDLLRFVDRVVHVAGRISE